MTNEDRRKLALAQAKRERKNAKRVYYWTGVRG